MKAYPAIALLEFKDIAAGLFTMDAMVKKAPVAVLKSGTISAGRFLVLVGGTTGSVEESHAEGLAIGKDSLVDQVFLPDVHPAVHDGLLGKRSVPKWSGSVGIVETQTIACNVLAAEIAMKTTDLALVELRLADSWLAGKGLAIYHGELHDVQEALRQAVGALEARGIDVMHRIISRPHEAFTAQVAKSTNFETSELLPLEGEEVKY